MLLTLFKRLAILGSFSREVSVIKFTCQMLSVVWESSSVDGKGAGEVEECTPAT